MDAAPRRTLVQCRSAPYGSSRAREAVEMAMAFGAFEQHVSLLFLGDGVLSLLKDQHPPADVARSLAKLLGTLPDYGIETVHVDADALAALGLTRDDFVLPVTLVAAADLSRLHAAHDVVLTV